MDPKLIRIDEKLHEILSSVSFSQYLNPINISRAYKRFLEGESNPPFQYRIFHQAPDILLALRSLRPSTNHPFGALLQEKIESTILMVQALHQRTPESFDRLAKVHHWYPTKELLGLRFAPQKNTYTPIHKTEYDLKIYLEEALHQRHQYDWDIIFDSSMSARVLVQSAQKKIFIKKNSRFSNQDLPRLVVHEIDVHAMRSCNGAKQPLHMFQTGLPNALSTEEGLAIIAEERAQLLNPNTLVHQTQVVWAIHQAKHLGFRELYEQLKLRVGPHLSWAICLRVKRGLSKPENPGVYAKDSIYLSGWKRVHDWLSNGGDINLLYVGSVDISHPIAEWMAQGWIKKQPVPTVWKIDSQNL